MGWFLNFFFASNEGLSEIMYVIYLDTFSVGEEQWVDKLNEVFTSQSKKRRDDDLFDVSIPSTSKDERYVKIVFRAIIKDWIICTRYLIFDLRLFLEVIIIK